jgi:hypothetical protein
MNPDNKFHPEAVARRAWEHETSAARHIVSNPLHYHEPAPPTPPTLEDKLEQAYWDFDVERELAGAERDAFKRQVRLLVNDALTAFALKVEQVLQGPDPMGEVEGVMASVLDLDNVTDRESSPVITSSRKDAP